MIGILEIIGKLKQTNNGYHDTGSNHYHDNGTKKQ